MFSFEVDPVFRGATYIDALQIVDADTGSNLSFDPADVLIWRLFPAGRRRGWGLGFGYGLGWDYGFGTGNAGAGPLNSAALVTLTVGAGLTAMSSGVVQWLLNEGQTLCLHRSEYRMTLDLTRYGQTARILDTTLQVMD